MPGKRELEVKAILRDEITGKLDEIRKSVVQFNKEANNMMRPWLALQRTMFSFLRLVAPLIIGFIGMKKAVEDVRREMSDLDRTAIRLGITTSELSQRRHGFNIDTTESRITIGRWEKFKQDFNNFRLKVGSGISNFIGSGIKSFRSAQIAGQMEHEEAQRLRRPLTYDERMALSKQARPKAEEKLLEEARAVKENSKEAYDALAELKLKTDQLTLSSFEFKKQKFEEEIELYRQAGANQQALTEYRAAYEKNSAREVALEVKKQQAEALKARGETIAAQNLLDDIALEEYKRKWGENGEAVQSFKAAQEAMKNERSHFVQLSKDIGQAMASSMGDLFVDGITNKFKSAQDIAASFGRSILKMLGDLAAQYAISATLGSVFPGFNMMGLPRRHTGGIIRAHSGLAVDEVPIIAQRGEGILSRSAMDKLGKSNFERLNRGESMGEGPVILQQPVIVIKAWDTSDIVSRRKDIESIVANALRFNSKMLTDALRTYG